MTAFALPLHSLLVASPRGLHLGRQILPHRLSSTSPASAGATASARDAASSRRPASACTPAESDAIHFSEGPSVRFWREYVPVASGTFPSRFSSLLSTAFSTFATAPSEVFHWAHGGFRVLLHLGLNAGGLALRAGTGEISAEGLKSALVGRNYFATVEEAGHVFLQDRSRVLEGVYHSPWDAALVHTRNPAFVVLEAVRSASEALRIMRRRREGVDGAEVWLEGDVYPEYYRKMFHYQTDGWLSSRSAETYELLTEALFLGRQDAMQRLTLVALSEFLGRPGEVTGAEQAMHVVELGTGTGRFATFVRDNWPDAEYLLSDLSPFYLQKARENMRYWESTAEHGRKSQGKVRYVQARAEKLPVGDGEADVVFAVYLFHELPPRTRRAVVEEAARLLRPGGLFIVTDSVQLGDRPALDERLESFRQFNEPWYESYVKEKFAKLVTEGEAFVPLRKEVCSVTKMLSFIRS